MKYFFVHEMCKSWKARELAKSLLKNKPKKGTPDLLFSLYHLVFKSNCSTVSQFHNHAQLLKVETSSGPLDNQTWQTEWKTAPLAKVQLCEYKFQTLEVFVAVSHLYTMFDCPVAHQNF